MKRKLVLFDIDGTLLLSRGAGRRALVAAMADFLEAPAVAAELVRFDGKTDPQIVAEMLAAAGQPRPEDPARIAVVLDRYLALLEAELARPDHATDVMPGVPELLAAVERDSDAVLGLLTGNVMAGARLKLRSAAIDPGRFVVGAYGSDHPERTRLPAIAAARAEQHFGRAPHGAEIVIIGDTPADVTCGAALGVRAIGVATGSYSTAELASAGAYAVFEDLSLVAAVRDAIWS
jgi:phosphoglycolate phosphatase-like HAD superfamily hydrolase